MLEHAQVWAFSASWIIDSSKERSCRGCRSTRVLKRNPRIGHRDGAEDGYGEALARLTQTRANRSAMG